MLIDVVLTLDRLLTMQLRTLSMHSDTFVLCRALDAGAPSHAGNWPWSQHILYSNSLADEIFLSSLDIWFSIVSMATVITSYKLFTQSVVPSLQNQTSLFFNTTVAAKCMLVLFPRNKGENEKTVGS